MNPKIIVLLFFLICGALLEPLEKGYDLPINPEEALEKGYDLPIDPDEQEEAEADCKTAMELIAEIYINADKGIASNTVIESNAMRQMQEKIQELNYPVYTSKRYSNMKNHQKMEQFLIDSSEKKVGEVVLYTINFDGGIRRNKFEFDGKDMYVLGVKAIWNDENNPMISSVSYTRIKEWNYTDKGWFCYELCVPEPPEVTEIVNGSCMLRVKPLKNEYILFSEQYLYPLGYQGNNILCSDWDSRHLEELDYNGMYEYLYQMKYQEKIAEEDDRNGIPAERFETLIMEYLPVSAEQLRAYAAFDAKNQMYQWERLGCGNYSPTSFGTSLPEVTDIRENEDGTVTVTIDAVCEMMLCNDAV